jgi:hypothetical protein
MRKVSAKQNQGIAPLQLEMPWYARPMFNPKSLPIGALIAIVLLISALLFFSRPVPTTLQFDNQPDHTVSFSDRGPTRLLLRMTHGAQAEITSVAADPADAVRILAQPGACTRDRMLTTNVPVCALWIAPGPAADKSARVRIAYRTPGETAASEIVLRVR